MAVTQTKTAGASTLMRPAKVTEITKYVEILRGVEIVIMENVAASAMAQTTVGTMNYNVILEKVRVGLQIWTPTPLVVKSAEISSGGLVSLEINVNLFTKEKAMEWTKVKQRAARMERKSVEHLLQKGPAQEEGTADLAMR
mmetsp:Transcript_12269/g.30217  ORF Transcript_12269/g.30217 Transcript_12269/m.30217 type:complete len:141 (+) Transcript_12269:429-851(+)